MGQPKGYGQTPLWQARRQLSYMTTMLERRRVKYRESLASDEWKIQALKAQIAELEKADAK